MLRLDLVVGPNGAGKTTLVQKILAPRIPGSVFVNADEIARQRWPRSAESHAYEAAKIAAATRSELIARHRPFIAETVFSHPSKLELIADAHAEGFTVVLHVLLVPVELSVARVPHRVAAGGHSVPEEKIRERHRRLWPLVAEAIPAADTATVYDTAGETRSRIVAQFSGGLPVGAPAWPDWADAALTDRWPGN
jgi:predicted ABC-type ATPase